MRLKEVFADQRDNAGIEYKINKLRGEYELFKGEEPVVIAGILGPDS